jgi:5-methylcytosine-specific restriction endonuclease McrA
MDLHTYVQPNSATKDHLVPRCKKGATDAFNIVAACYDCNQAKADMPAAVFMGIVRRRLDKNG